MKNHLGYEIHKIEHLISRSLDNAMLVSIGNDITPAQAFIIKFIAMESNDKDIYQKDIEAEFDIKRSAVSLILKNMEDKSLVKRITVDSDLRLKKIVLTKKSIMLCNNISKIVDDIDEKLSCGITGEELKILFTALNKIRKNLE